MINFEKLSTEVTVNGDIFKIIISILFIKKNIRVPAQVKLTVEKLKVELFERQELFIKAP